MAEWNSKLDLERPSTFFPLNSYLSNGSLVFFSYFSALPVAAFFFVICWRSKETITFSVKNFSPKVINGFLPEEYHSNIFSLFENHFDNFSYLSPLIVLIAFLYLFAPYINFPLSGLQKLFVRSTGMNDRIDELLIDASRSALATASNNYDELRTRLAKILNVAIPLREELATANDLQKTAYALTYAARSKTRQYGLRRGLSFLLDDLKVPHVRQDTPMLPRFDWQMVFTSGPAFTALCAFFVVLFAFGTGPSVHIEGVWNPRLFEWVYEPHSGSIQLLRYLFCFVLPLYFGFFYTLPDVERTKRQEV